MAELKIDIDGINNKVIPPLNKAKTELESAANSLSAISYSPDYYKFTNRSRVQSVLPQNIRNIKTDVNNINKWLSDISTRFKEADRKSNNSVNSLLGKLDKINLSNGIGKTGGTIVGVAAQGMAIGQNNITTFAQKGFELAETIVNGVQDGINFVGAKISSAWDSFYNKIVKPGINFFEECKAKVSNFVTGAVNEISNGINKIKDGITSFAQKGWDKLCGMAQSVGDAFNSVGAHISSAWNSFCTDVWPNIWDGIQSFGASVANVVIGFVKGLCQFVESLVDVVVILGTAIGSIGTGIYDGISYLVSLADGTSDEWQSATGAMWQGVMGFVAEDHVGNAFADFYKNNAVGQWLDGHAIDVCKSDGIVTNIASGFGYVAGIVLLTIATLGIGTAISAGATTMSFATTSAVVATTAATGKYTQEAWGEARDSSWEGIERLYEKGEITEEEYNTFTAIRSMTDEQWAEIEKDYKDGKISEEEFEQIKQIREMPEDWKTFENGWKGLLYGVANGVWEGVQWYVGGKLAGWTIKGGSQLASSTIRVGTDTAFNALDTPFRTAIDTITSGKTWDQAWEEQGGWQSVLTDIGIGLIGSTGGEVFDGVKLNKASKTLDANHAFDSLDETTAKKVKDALLDDHKAGKINLSKITDNELNEAINKKVINATKQVNLNNNILKNYIDNIQDYSSKGISIEEFLQKNGINIIDNNTRLSVAESLGDSKLYMLVCADDILKNGNLSDSQRKNLNNLLTAYGNERVGNLDISDMLTNLQQYLSKEQVQTVIDLAQSGMADKLSSSYTAEQLASVFNYTACGGFEINAWLNDINLPQSSTKARDAFDSVSKIQDAISGYGSNKIFDSTQGDILDCLDSVISSANYDDAIVTYRGIKELYDRDVKIDVQNLKIGDSFESSGYQSSSVLLDNCYGIQHDDTNIILRVIVPPNSGTGAYIENITGVSKYGQMEMLIKRDAKMTVVGDLEFMEVDGIMKTIVPVIVE